MEIDVQIERIDNGYIVTGNDSTRNRMYYPNIEAFVKDRVLEELKHRDEAARPNGELWGAQRSGASPEQPFTFKLVSDL